MRTSFPISWVLALVPLLLSTVSFGSSIAEMDVTIPNPAAVGVTLSGTLSTPNSEHKPPAILLISGAGPQDRDGTMAGHKPFLALAQYLTQRGFAVLRMDDRGTGQSTGKFEGATTADFATDAEAELTFLRSRPEVDSANVGVLGHGEGAIIAAMLAAKDPGLSFAVLLACPAVPGIDVLLAQTMQAETVSGLPQEQIEADAQIGSTLYKLAAEGKGEGDMEAALKKMSHNVPPFALASWKAQIPRLTNPWLRFFLTYDPATVLERVHCPVLALYGERDLQVLPEQNAPELERALKKAHNKEATVLQLSQLNYMFQTSKTGLGSEYATIPEDISPVALHDIGLWLVRVTSAHKADKPASP
jgi:hypothetical protein